MDGSRLPARVGRALPVALVLGLASIGLALASCSSLERPIVSVPGVEGATFVGNKACVDCHVNFTRLFPSSPHARIHVSDLPRGESGGCESCHGPGSLHVQAGGGRKLIVNPG